MKRSAISHIDLCYIGCVERVYREPVLDWLMFYLMHLLGKCFCCDLHVHTEKPFRNLIESNRNKIVFTIFRLISNQTDIRLVPHQSENYQYNLISV